MSNVTKIRKTIMEYYHREILRFYSGILKSHTLPHMYFDNMHSPELILHDDKPVFIGRIEVDSQGVSNFIHETPLSVCVEGDCEVLSMQDFITYGRLSSLSTIRQIDESEPDKKFYAYQTIDGKKSAPLEVFPLLRAGSSEATYTLRNHINHLLKGETKQVDIAYDQPEAKWILDNEERFEDICSRLDIIIFKAAEHFMLTVSSGIDNQ